MSDDEKSNVVSLFWWRHVRIKPIPPPPPLTTDQKIAKALAKWGSHNKAKRD